MRLAEAALRQGAAARATELFERAASLEHASDIEVGLVRSLMQSGHYRRALAFAAHTAGAHARQTGGAALYAWLLAAGGHADFAKRVLDEAQRRVPSGELLDRLAQRLDARLSMEADARLPAWLAPAATRPATDVDAAGGGTGIDVVPPELARVAATGVLVGDGRHVLASSAAIPDGAALWVRDGLGGTVTASVDRRIDALGVVVLRLHQPLATGPALAMTERDAFPGTPAHAVGYLAAGDARPAWPWLHSGFLGPVRPGQRARRLGIELRPGPRGGPVFDATGRFAGMTLASAGEPDLLVPASALRAEIGEVLGSATQPLDAPRMALDEIYERALQVTVQVITAP